MNIPNDADGDAMRRIISSGSDPARPMTIDYMISCPDVATGERIAALASLLDYSTKVSVDAKDESVTCYCTKHMLLEYDALIAAKKELHTLAEQHGGYIDGWGTFGNISKEQP